MEETEALVMSVAIVVVVVEVLVLKGKILPRVRDGAG